MNFSVENTLVTENNQTKVISRFETEKNKYELRTKKNLYGQIESTVIDYQNTNVEGLIIYGKSVQSILVSEGKATKKNLVENHLQAINKVKQLF